MTLGARELGAQKRRHDFGGERRTHHSCSQRDDVHRIIFDASYLAILKQVEWKKRLEKAHTQSARSLPRAERSWKELDSCIEYYPTGTAAVMKELGEGSRDMTLTVTGWDINPRAIGIVPQDYKVLPFKGMTWVNDAHYIVIPKGVTYQWTNVSEKNYIDGLVFNKLKNLRMLPSEICNDETFLRRAFLEDAAEASASAAPTTRFAHGVACVLICDPTSRARRDASCQPDCLRFRA